MELIDKFLSVFESLFKDATGRVLVERIILLSTFAFFALLWSKSELIANTYIKSRYKTYIEIIEDQKNRNFQQVLQEQVQVLHSSAKADFSAIYTLRPKEVNNFADLSVYEGTLPSTVDIKTNMSRPIDKTSDQYVAQLTGRDYESTYEFVYFPGEKPDEINYMYSCPFFNSNNVYAGSIEVYYKNSPSHKSERLFSICNHIARVLGRAD